jgi:hypothetical protein
MTSQGLQVPPVRLPANAPLPAAESHAIDLIRGAVDAGDITPASQPPPNVLDDPLAGADDGDEEAGLIARQQQEDLRRRAGQ